MTNGLLLYMVKYLRIFSNIKTFYDFATDPIYEENFVFFFFSVSYPETTSTFRSLTFFSLCNAVARWHRGAGIRKIRRQQQKKPLLICSLYACDQRPSPPASNSPYCEVYPYSSLLRFYIEKRKLYNKDQATNNFPKQNKISTVFLLMRGSVF